MLYDERTNTLKPYQTKVERIKELEEAMERIAVISYKKEECVALAISMRRKEKRKLSKESPRSHIKLAAVFGQLKRN